MNSLLTTFLIPLGIVMIGLVAEYWLVQPYRKARAATTKGSDRKSTKAIGEPLQIGSFGNSIARMLESTSTLSASSVSARVIEKIGLALSMIPMFLLSLLAIIAAIPTFVVLYFSEKHAQCKFTPTCREYLVKSVEIHGPATGLWLSLKRMFRCNPFFVGGDDPVPLLGSSSRRSIVLEDPNKLRRGFQVTLKAVLFLGLMYSLTFSAWFAVGPKRSILALHYLKEHLVVTIGLALLVWCIACALMGRLALSFVRQSWLFVMTIYALCGLGLLLIKLLPFTFK